MPESICPGYIRRQQRRAACGCRALVVPVDSYDDPSICQAIAFIYSSPQPREASDLLSARCVRCVTFMSDAMRYDESQASRHSGGGGSLGFLRSATFIDG